MAILQQTFIPWDVRGFGEWVDIDPNTFTGDFNSYTVRGASDVICGLIPEIRVSTEDGCFFFINNPTPATGTLPCADLGVPYYQNLASADTVTTSYSLYGGLLPPGLTLSSAGVISGTPEPFRFGIQISDTSGASFTTQEFSMLYCCDDSTGGNTDSAIANNPAVRFFRATNLTFVRGDSYRFQSTVYMNGEIVDLTGAGVRLTAKYAVTDSDTDAVFIKYSPFNGISITDPTNGLITVTLDPADTFSLPTHSVNLVYDIQLYYPVLEVYTFQQGIFTILPDVTRLIN